MTYDPDDRTYPVSRLTSEPSDADLECLERIAARRAEIEAVRPGRRQLETRSFLLRTLNEMEETLCLQGCRSRVVREGWKTLARFARFGRPGGGR